MGLHKYTTTLQGAIGGGFPVPLHCTQWWGVGILQCTTPLKEVLGSGPASRYYCAMVGNERWVQEAVGSGYPLVCRRSAGLVGLLEYTVALRGAMAVGPLQSAVALQEVVGVLW